jgi:2-C-methyl-D-erythritol 4-phosphate cytidylyltransferase/2-C-methyl-D-erythritol 2,4-cyclodiphosphate synthase
MKTIAVVLASGTGTRFDKNIIKQYQTINDHSVIYHSVLALKKNINVDKIVIVINKKHKDIAKKTLKGLNITNFVTGGNSRQKSVYNALKYIKKYNPTNVLIHDSVRPNIEDSLINTLVKKLDKYVAVIPAIKINDSLKNINNNIVTEHLDRNKFYLAQTPQAFKYKDLLLKHKLNINNNNITDDSTLFDNVHKINGNTSNLKITTKADLKLLEIMMHKEIKHIQISAIGIDVHKFSLTKATLIKLGGVSIKHNKKLIGHSDADVVLHALVDSILGTVSEGDIGSIFSNKDPKWKNANSIIFVKHAISLLNKHKCNLLHTDINIICEEPKISLYRNKIKKSIAKLLCISEKCVSIKATTTETLGFTGRKEGIMAQCITTISKPI